MKLSTYSPKAARDQRRERWRYDRSAAPTVRAAFPNVERIVIDLNFAEETARAPVPQSYALHSPAHAFFQFPCAHADCDGQFDLTTDVTAVLKSSLTQADGKLSCTGARIKDHTGRQPCHLLVNYAVKVDYR